ncbi:MAG: LemA family protein [Sphingobacteriales bacterium]|nr:MAG: LemA family protein [Sphingobacteriales bacterium]
MRKGSIVIIVLLALLLIGGCQACNIQKTLVSTEENVKGKWGEVQNQYQRRADLIPNLVNTVKGAANFEQKTLTDVINARAKATSIQVNPENLTPEKLQEFQNAQGELSQALGRLMVVTENYPELKANQNFLALQDQLEGTENRITVARKNFNEAVQEYNVQVRTFPNSIFAGMLGFEKKGMFEADAAAQKAPQVQF